MKRDELEIVVLCGDAACDSTLMKILPDLPQVQILGQFSAPKDLLQHLKGTVPDLVIVDLGTQKSLPEWLDNLHQFLPQSTVMVCSQHQEPDFLIRVLQSWVQEFLPLPTSKCDLEAALERVRAARKQRSGFEAARGKMVAVTGLKGGMGATAVAVNLAVALADLYPERVVLVDLGRPFPDVASFLDQRQRNGLEDLAQPGHHLDSSFVLKTLQPHPAKFSVLHGCENLEALDPAVLEKTWEILRSLFEWIVVDLGHWLDNLYLTTLQEADQVLLLTELSVPNLDNLKKLWGLFDRWNLDRDKVRIIVNRYQRDNGVGLADVERIQHRPIFLTLPYDDQGLSEAINHGVPLKELSPRSKLCRSLHDLAEDLATKPWSALHELPAQKKTKWRFLLF